MSDILLPLQNLTWIYYMCNVTYSAHVKQYLCDSFKGFNDICHGFETYNKLLCFL